jgi:5'-deoxynucleotidase YfbR-like HD superfamily hydrolase
MKHLTKLFKLLELTRSQPQYGYALRGIAQDNLSNLAEHHYLVAFIGWQLALEANRSGAHLNVLKVLEICLMHDLGELFGGDICLPYSRVNPKARNLAKAFEAENQNFLSKMFGSGETHFKSLALETMQPKSDEAIVAKLADYLETTHYLQYANSVDKESLGFVVELKK